MTDDMGRKPNHPLYVPKGHHWRCIGEGPRKTCLLKDVFIRHGDIFLVDSSGSDTAPTRTPDVSEKDKYQYHKRLDSWPVHHYTPEEAAKLRAAAAVDAQRAKGLASREAELEDYSRKKQAWAAQEKKIADRAEAEYEAEEQELRAMGGSSTPDRDSAGAGLELLRTFNKIRRHVAGAGKRTQKRLATQR